MKTKSSVYRDRLLREMPTHTKGGTPVEIDPSGNYVRTLRNGARNGSHSVYTLCDYPKLFGWDTAKPKAKKPPAIIYYRRRPYLRLTLR